MTHLPPTRIQAIQKARKYAAERPLFLDTETTGLESRDEILEICIADGAGNILLESLVRPTRPIPREATRVHGITDQMAAQAPGWNSVWAQAEPILSGHLVGIYNAEYDLRLLQQTFRAHGLSFRSLPFRPFCIMELYAHFYGQRHPTYGSYRWQSLGNAVLQCRLPIKEAHRARADTLMARAVFQYMAEYFPE